MNDLLDDVGDVIGLPGRAVREGGALPLELETVAPVDGIVPANTKLVRRSGGWSPAQRKILSATIEIHIFSVVQI